ncbi:MAG: gliding motility-associated C-terminal domain-containing protein [Saprospiraceae bacterium]|nr:gliding motility-associated C-terminal domain-containing protein [Saprospiraceae bacterium]
MLRIFLLPIFLLTTTLLFAQICDGNLGDNIFTEGDFGSGPNNILPQNPNIAPGYIYSTNPPPNDGFYTISNNTGPWAGIFDWVSTQDNSSDARGYMMIVNASYSPGLFYEQEVDNLCANTLYEFSADIFNLIPSGKNLIKPNVSFEIDGVEVFNTGEIPENESWNNYGFTFTTNPGQTTVTLSLRNKAPGGNGNDLALDNISFRPCGPLALILPDVVENICENGNPITLNATINGDQYDTPWLQWQLSNDEGANWFNINGAIDDNVVHNNLNGGRYFYRYLLANDSSNLQNSKCRVVSNWKIVNVVPKFYDLLDTICEGSSFQLGDRMIAQAGIFVDSFQSVFGCDSIVTLELAVAPDPGIAVGFTQQDPSCFGDGDGVIGIDSITRGYPPYQILVNGAPTTLPFRRINQEAGGFEFDIVDRFGCRFSEELFLFDPPQLVVDIGDNLQADLGEVLTLFPQSSLPIQTYQWSPPNWFDCGDCPIGRVAPSENGIAVLEVIDSNGCRAIDSVFIELLEVRKVYIPNAFSPNGDGINDIFTIYGDEPNVSGIVQLQVYDRWGDLVFETRKLLPNSEEGGWDGTFAGKELDPGVFTYVAEVLFLDGKVIRYSGDISIVK